MQRNAKKGSQVDKVEQENLFDDGHQEENQDVHTYYGSVELGSVSYNRKTNKILITINIAGTDVQIKADMGAESTVIPYICKRKLQRSLYERSSNH